MSGTTMKQNGAQAFFIPSSTTGLCLAGLGAHVTVSLYFLSTIAKILSYDNKRV